MADNVIEVVIKTLLEGGDRPAAMAKSLNELAQQGIVTSKHLEGLSSVLDSLNKKFGATGVAEFTAALGPDMRKAAAEFATGANQVVNSTNQVAQAYKASLDAATKYNQQAQGTGANYRSSIAAAADYAKALQDSKNKTNEAATAHANLGAAATVLNNRSLGLSRTLGFAATALGDLGPAGQIASNALFHVAISGAALASGVGLLSAGIGIVTTTLALFISHLQEAKKKKEDLDIALRTGDMAFFQKQIAEADAALVKLGASMDDVRARQASEAAAGVKPGGFLSSFAAGLTAEQTRILKERGEAEGTLQELIRRKTNQATNELDAQTQALGANIKAQEELAHESRVAAALQGDLANAAQSTRDAFIASSEALRDARVNEAIKQATLTQQAQADAAKKQIADVSASAKAQLAETTGSMAALESSFAQRRGAIIAAADADLKRQLAGNKVPELTGAITSSVEQKKQADLLAIELERTKTLTAARQQGREVEVASLKAQEQLAQSVVEIEQQRLQLLQQQQAPLAQQEAQQQVVLTAQENLARAIIANRERQLSILNEQIRSEGLVGDKAAAVKAQEVGITAELTKQRALLAAIPAQRDTARILQDRKNLLVGITQENQNQAEQEQFNGQRAVQLQSEELGIRTKIRDLGKELILAQTTDTKLKPIVEIILKYEDQKKAIEDLIQKYPELESVGTQALAALVKATQAAVDAANENQGAVTKLAQSLSDVFVQGIDKSFDALFDTSKNFGERMQNLFAGIGQDMVKQLLHAIITAPLKSTLDTLIKSLSSSDEEGGGLGGLFSGIGGLFGKLFGAIGRLFGAPTPAAHGQFFLPPNHAFAHGGLILPPNHAFAHGGYVVPDNLLRPFQHGGLVTRGPVMGLIGEAGGEVVAKLKPSGAGDWPSGQPVVNVHIAGDVVPRDPQMKPQDVITVSFADMDRGGKLSKAVVNIIKRTR